MRSMSRGARSAGFAAVATLAAVLACNDSSEDRTKSEVATTSPSYAAPSAPTKITSGDPLYDRWAAALTAAGIDFSPGRWGSYSSDQSICNGLRNGDVDAFQLAGREQLAARTENGRRIEIMIPILCPDQQAKLDEARGPNPMQRRSLGGKLFVAEAYDPTTPVIQPGVWSTGSVSDCYWERLDDQGNIIANNFVSISEAVVVEILASDAAFTSNNCGRWNRVGD